MNRRLAIAAFLALVPAGVIVACSFPTVNVLSLTDEDGGNDTGTLDGDKPDATFDSGGDGALPPDVDPDGGAKDATTVDVVVVDASGGCCDCDTDMYLSDASTSGGACTLDAGIVGFADCDDSIAALNPGSPFIINSDWPAETTHKPKFDWDCDGVVTKQLNYQVVCKSIAGLGCTGEGFNGDPGCGNQGNYFQCQGGLLSCNPVSVGMRTQGCK